MNFDKLFNPKSVAVIGAADDPTKLGYVIFKNLLSNKKRKIYPINPAFKKVLKIPCIPSVKNIKAPVDLAVIAVKPEIVPLVLADCGEKKIPHAIIITAGFKEIGGAGVEKENELKEIARKYKVNIVGPNCLGIIDGRAKLNATFGNDLPFIGDLAFVSQSGALGTAILDLAAKSGVGFSKFISVGNEAGATEIDFLEYLSKDKSTNAIIMYLEGVSNGKRFISVASEVTKKKPVIVLKAGRTSRGQKAVASHTGSLAPSDEIFKTACRQAGIILVDSFNDLMDIAKLLNAGLNELPSKWTVLTNGGGPSIIVSDLIESSKNLEMADIPESLKKKLLPVLPLSASLNNPIDIIGDALSDRYESALKVLAADKSVHGIIVILTPQKMTQVKETAAILAKYKKYKTIIPMFIGGNAILEAEKIFSHHKMVNFIDAAELVNALSALCKVRKKSSFKEIPPEKLTLRQLSSSESGKFLSDVGLSAVGEFIGKKEQLAELVKRIPFPWAIKVVSAQVVHKTDAGGVKTNIVNLPEAEAVCAEMEKVVPMHVPGAKIDGFIVQPMVSGSEVIVGMKRDTTFGPVIVFGLGGIFVEVLKDISMRVAPVSEKEAASMIEEIKGAPILLGGRGLPKLDVASLAKIINAVSRLAEKEKSIMEIDLNPVVLTPENALVIDARIMVSDHRS